MEKICKNCKFWGVSNRFPIKNAKIGKCMRVNMFLDATEWQIGDCDDMYSERTLKDEYKNEKFFVSDGSDSVAHLLPMEDFGCNQFESK